MDSHVNKQNKVNDQAQRGFTLVEVALVLLIVGFLFSGLISSFGEHRNTEKLKADAASLQTIKDALLSYVGVNGYLPCPDTDGDGVQNRDGNDRCSDVSGALPYQDLGVGLKDSYAQPFLYGVNTDADTADVLEMCEQASYFGFSGTASNNLQECEAPNQANDGVFYCSETQCDSACPVNCDAPSEQPETISVPPYFRVITPPIGSASSIQGSLQICNETATSCNASSSASDVLADYLVATVVALGENGTQTWDNCNNANSIEQENCDGDRFYHQYAQVKDEFDDQLVWLSAYEIKAQMVKMGKDLSVY